MMTWLIIHVVKLYHQVKTSIPVQNFLHARKQGNCGLTLVWIWSIVYFADVNYTCHFWDEAQRVSLLALNAYANINKDKHVVSVNTPRLWAMTIGIFFFGRLGRRVTL